MDDLKQHILSQRGLSFSNSSRSTFDPIKCSSSGSNKFFSSTLSSFKSKNSSSRNIQQSINDIYSNKDNNKPTIYNKNPNITDSIRTISLEHSYRLKKLNEMGGNRGRIEQFSRSINSLVGGEIKLKKKSSVNKSIHELEFDKEINELFTKKSIPRKFSKQEKILNEINVFSIHLEKEINKANSKSINKPVLNLDRPNLNLKINSFLNSSPIKLRNQLVMSNQKNASLSNPKDNFFSTFRNDKDSYLFK